MRFMRCSLEIRFFFGGNSKKILQDYSYYLTTFCYQISGDYYSSCFYISDVNVNSITLPTARILSKA